MMETLLVQEISCTLTFKVDKPIPSMRGVSITLEVGLAIGTWGKINMAKLQSYCNLYLQLYWRKVKTGYPCVGSGQWYSNMGYHCGIPLYTSIMGTNVHVILGHYKRFTESVLIMIEHPLYLMLRVIAASLWKHCHQLTKFACWGHMILVNHFLTCTQAKMPRPYTTMIMIILFKCMSQALKRKGQ